jgi:hypothetical protein
MLHLINKCMTQNERDALLTYLDFHMINLVHKYEVHLDPIAIHSLYEDVYYIMSDIENTIDTQREIQIAINKNKS